MRDMQASVRNAKGDRVDKPPRSMGYRLWVVEAGQGCQVKYLLQE